MVFPSRLLRGTLIRRYKRFLADIRLLNGRVVIAHCVNTGSMMGCREPGSPVYISRRPGRTRRLSYTWELVQVHDIHDTWVGINTSYPNGLVADAIQSGLIKELQGYESIRREVWVSPASRLDLCLERPKDRCYVEVKNVTLADQGIAAFPDAVTERGTKHLKELIRLRRKGEGAAMVFVIQRGDCSAFRPADEIDREYGLWLRKAIKAGVKVLPYVARVTPQEITLTHRLSIRI